eukprot:TRINITY_DN15874_c0_g1_i8.p1 TRINITY_DN15874_c0_g1~~TRINITY_DN15874_c0_g1_i8.p1  ORF type:complete len:157 (+),score=12.66 TRINITY_DN15874_c0_g1_i8:258-728(+)
MCFERGGGPIRDWNHCEYPAYCYYRRDFYFEEGLRGACVAGCDTNRCPLLASTNALFGRGTDKYCNQTNVGWDCVDYAARDARCGGYNLTTMTPLPPYCDWQSICLDNSTSLTPTWTCQPSACKQNCSWGTYCYATKIGRAVQQECRDRSRMPSSA